MPANRHPAKPKVHFAPDLFGIYLRLLYICADKKYYEIRSVMRISFVGAGNVATHMAAAFARAGHEIVGIYSRTSAAAERLAARTGGQAVTDMRLLPAAEVVVFAVKDDALPALIRETEGREAALFVHTAGSIPAEIFEGHCRQYGVLYPLQTFSKSRETDFRTVPCLVEGNDDAALRTVMSLARDVSDDVRVLNSGDRRYVHLAAVFACNFTNHCYALASELLRRQKIDPEILLPLIAETASKVAEMPPRTAQTGPAVRGDRGVMAAHLDLLGGETLTAELYRLMSRSIYKLSNDGKNDD